MVGPGVLGGRVKRGVGSNVSLLGVVGWVRVGVGSLERGMVGLGDGGVTGPGRVEGSDVVGSGVLGGLVKGVGLIVGPSLGVVGCVRVGVGSLELVGCDVGVRGIVGLGDGSTGAGWEGSFVVGALVGLNVRGGRVGGKTVG